MLHETLQPFFIDVDVFKGKVDLDAIKFRAGRTIR